MYVRPLKGLLLTQDPGGGIVLIMNCSFTTIGIYPYINIIHKAVKAGWTVIGESELWVANEWSLQYIEGSNYKYNY